MKCNCKITIKNGFKTLLNSPLISQPINLATLPESQYELFKGIFPDAFEKNCTCKYVESSDEKLPQDIVTTKFKGDKKQGK